MSYIKVIKTYEIVDRRCADNYQFTTAELAYERLAETLVARKFGQFDKDLTNTNWARYLGILTSRLARWLQWKDQLEIDPPLTMYEKYNDLPEDERELANYIEIYCAGKRALADKHKYNCDGACLLAAVCYPATWPHGEDIPKDIWEATEKYPPED